MGFNPKAFKKKTASVIGLGKSGQAAARLLKKKGFKVFGSDTRKRGELKLAVSIPLEAGGHTERVYKSSFIVKSPGLPQRLPIFANSPVPVFSEMEVGLAFSKTREIVAITGTNGKTTTTAMTAAIFKAAGKKIAVCGNIGTPFCDEAPKAKHGIVCEVSSYQLEDSSDFHPRAAALLNVTADHIDHHGGMQNYVAAKAKAFKNMGPGDFAVFNAADPICLRIARETAAEKLFFGPGAKNAWYEAPFIYARLRGKPIKLTPPKLPGRHNVDNAMAAALLALSRGIKPAAINKAFKAFKGVEHRLEDCGTMKGGVDCVNDSKATNVDSTLVALEAVAKGDKNVLLILGGLHKGSPYTPLRGLVERGVKAILTIGAAARKVEEDLGGLVPIFPCGDLATAVDTAAKIGFKGDLLLLSPACASFDQFTDYEDRGRRFKKLVKDHS